MKKTYSTPEILVISTFSDESIANAVIDGNATMVGKTTRGDILYDYNSDKSRGDDVVEGHFRWGNLWD